MAHDHHHHHGPVNPEHIGRAFRIGITLNILYVIIEFGYGFYTNSLALLADAGHNLSDVGSLALSLFAFSLARKNSTKKFTYGYRKATILASLANAILLLVVVGGIGYEAVSRFLHSEKSDGAIIAWVSGAGVLVNAFTAWLFFKDKQHDLNVKGAYLHLFADTLVSVGVVVAGIAIAYTGWDWLDPSISLIIMIVILVSTWGLLRESLALALDAVPENVDTDKIRQLIGKMPGVNSVEHVHVWAISTTQNALTAHICVPADTTPAGAEKIKEEIRHELFHQNIGHATLELEFGETPASSEGQCEMDQHTY
ncbi:MAG: cation transporter [Mucilaginibacter polytrichastri]|nr:cation transporter [Mucilaginibacter polytrichastri]